MIKEEGVVETEERPRTMPPEYGGYNRDPEPGTPKG